MEDTCAFGEYFDWSNDVAVPSKGVVYERIRFIGIETLKRTCHWTRAMELYIIGKFAIQLPYKLLVNEQWGSAEEAFEELQLEPFFECLTSPELRAMFPREWSVANDRDFLNLLAFGHGGLLVRRVPESKNKLVLDLGYLTEFEQQKIDVVRRKSSQLRNLG